MTSKEIDHQTFNLLQWFGVLSLVCITLTSLLSAYVLSRFLEKQLLQREAIVSMEFIQSVAKINNPEPYFLGKMDNQDMGGHIEEFMKHIIAMPEVLGANIYAKNKSIIWSSNPDLIGRVFADNEELMQALNGQFVIERAGYDDIEAGGWNQEQTRLEDTIHSADNGEYIESYLPVWNLKHDNIIGAVELYEQPLALLHALNKVKWLVVIITLLSSTVLYAMLFWIVRHGKRMLAMQQKSLVESEKMAAVGSMTESIAHSIRNPIASIRSSAELAMEDANPDTYECLEDIVLEVDRFDRWICDLLTYSNVPDSNAERGSLKAAIEMSIRGFGKRPQKRGVKIQLDLPPDLPNVQGEERLLTQVFNSLIANALEAIDGEGEISIKALRDGKYVRVYVLDSGRGIDADMITMMFTPMHSEKKGGLGMGLSLAKRTIEGFKGTLSLDSEFGRGTTAHVCLPVAA